MSDRCRRQLRQKSAPPRPTVLKAVTRTVSRGILHSLKWECTRSESSLEMNFVSPPHEYRYPSISMQPLDKYRYPPMQPKSKTACEGVGERYRYPSTPPQDKEGKNKRHHPTMPPRSKTACVGVGERYRYPSMPPQDKEGKNKRHHPTMPPRSKTACEGVSERYRVPSMPPQDEYRYPSIPPEDERGQNKHPHPTMPLRSKTACEGVGERYRYNTRSPRKNIMNDDVKRNGYQTHSMFSRNIPNKSVEKENLHRNMLPRRKMTEDDKDGKEYTILTRRNTSSVSDTIDKVIKQKRIDAEPIIQRKWEDILRTVSNMPNDLKIKRCRNGARQRKSVSCNNTISYRNMNLQETYKIATRTKSPCSKQGLHYKQNSPYYDRGDKIQERKFNDENNVKILDYCHKVSKESSNIPTKNKPEKITKTFRYKVVIPPTDKIVGSQVIQTNTSDQETLSDKNSACSARRTIQPKTHSKTYKNNQEDMILHANKIQNIFQFTVGPSTASNCVPTASKHFEVPRVNNTSKSACVGYEMPTTKGKPEDKAHRKVPLQSNSTTQHSPGLYHRSAVHSAVAEPNKLIQEELPKTLIGHGMKLEPSSTESETVSEVLTTGTSTADSTLQAHHEKTLIFHLKSALAVLEGKRDTTPAAQQAAGLRDTTPAAQQAAGLTSSDSTSTERRRSESQRNVCERKAGNTNTRTSLHLPYIVNDRKGPPVHKSQNKCHSMKENVSTTGKNYTISSKTPPHSQNRYRYQVEPRANSPHTEAILRSKLLQNNATLTNALPESSSRGYNNRPNVRGTTDGRGSMTRFLSREREPVPSHLCPSRLGRRPQSAPLGRWRADNDRCATLSSGQHAARDMTSDSSSEVPPHTETSSETEPLTWSAFKTEEVHHKHTQDEMQKKLDTEKNETKQPHRTAFHADIKVTENMKNVFTEKKAQKLRAISLGNPRNSRDCGKEGRGRKERRNGRDHYQDKTEREGGIVRKFNCGKNANDLKSRVDCQYREQEQRVEKRVALERKVGKTKEKHDMSEKKTGASRNKVHGKGGHDVKEHRKISALQTENFPEDQQNREYECKEESVNRPNKDKNENINKAYKNRIYGDNSDESMKTTRNNRKPVYENKKVLENEEKIRRQCHIEQRVKIDENRTRKKHYCKESEPRGCLNNMESARVDRIHEFDPHRISPGKHVGRKRCGKEKQVVPQDGNQVICGYDEPSKMRFMKNMNGNISEHDEICLVYDDIRADKESSVKYPKTSKKRLRRTYSADVAIGNSKRAANDTKSTYANEKKYRSSSRPNVLLTDCIYNNRYRDIVELDTKKLSAGDVLNIQNDIVKLKKCLDVLTAQETEG